MSGGRKSDPFLGRSLVERPAVGSVRLKQRRAWNGYTKRNELANEFGERKMRRVIRGRDNISGRRIA